MKKLLTIILVASSFFATAQVKISALPAATDTPALSSLTAIVESGTTKKATLQKLKNAILKDVTASTVNGWDLTGNSGTNSAINFIGTMDSNAFTIKTNSIERSRFSANGEFIQWTSSSPNDTFHISFTKSALGLGINALRFQHKTNDGESGVVAIDATGFGKTRNYSVFGFTDYAAKNAIVESYYDSLSHEGGLHLEVQNDSFRYTARLATDSGFVFRCPLVYIDGLQGVGKVLTSNANGGASWGTLASSQLNPDSLAKYSWSLTGNSGTDSTNFIGTIDNQPLHFRQNDSAYGYFSETNIAIGFNAGQQLTESIGSRNVYIGYEAGRYDAGGGSTADDNIGIGNQTLLLNKGLSNIAIGSTALDNNVSGNQNIAIGEGAKTFTDSTSEALAIGNGAVASANQIKFSNIYDSLYIDLGTSDVPCVGCVITNVDGVGSASWQPLATDTTWSPTVTLVGGTGNTTPVYTTNLARYEKIGHIVFCSVELLGDGGAEGAGTGVINIALPVAAGNNQLHIEYPCGRAVNGATEHILFGTISANSTTVTLSQQTAANSTTPFQGNDQNNTSRHIDLQFWYKVD